MKKEKNYARLLIIGVLFLSMTACNDDDAPVPQKEVGIELPSAISMVYGEQQEITVPANILDAADLQITLDFSGNENIKVNTSEFLDDKLRKAVTVSEKAGIINVDSGLLYPNNAVSSANGVKLPDTYKITVIVSSANKNFKGTQTIDLKITAAKVSIKGLDSKASIPVAYVIYGDTASFEFESSQAVTENFSWKVENQSSIGTETTLNSNILKFGANAGDPDKKVEKAYDVSPLLLKDGFIVGSTKFRVIFIPKIKFFFGSYYPEYDLTILLNNLHIALSNGYVSAAPTLSPETYKSTFAINGIKKDGQLFSDVDAVFSINEKTGSITVKKNTSLTEGAYEITVKALTTTGLEFLTTLTLNMSKA